MTIDERVIRFKATGEEFPAIAEHFQYLFANFHAHLVKRLPLPKDELFNDFQYVLFRSLVRFDEDKAKSKDKTFERYFAAAMRKFANSIKRRHAQHRRRKYVSIDGGHDLEDLKPQPSRVELETKDLLVGCIGANAERQVAALRLMGHAGHEVCSVLKITAYEYRSRMSRMRRNARLVKNLSSK